MDAVLFLAILSIILMMGTNISLKYRYVTLLKIFGYACGIACFGTLLAIDPKEKLMLILSGLSVLAASEVLYFSNLLKYTNNFYHEISRKFAFCNVSFYAFVISVILVRLKFHEYVVTYFPLPISVIFLSIFLKIVMASNFIWNRGNIFFAKIAPSNDKNKALLYVDLLSLLSYVFAFIFADIHDRIVLSILAILLIFSKFILPLLLLKAFRTKEIKIRFSLASVVSVTVFFILTSVGIILCI